MMYDEVVIGARAIPGLKPQFKQPYPIRKRDIAPIVEAVCDIMDIAIAHVKSSWRNRDVSECRMVCQYIIRKNTTWNLAEIGKYFGGRDHTTIVHATKVVRGRMQVEPEFKALVDRVENEVICGR